ncbi:MAG: hypothetical protein HY554_01855 [Elusimicrobia bacterium]|nr:hypothetical protein [Elusimicrobiota bacterium]
MTSIRFRSILHLAVLLGTAPLAQAAAPEAPKPLGRAQAVAAAEKLIAEQGHLEPVEPKAAGARLDSGVWFVGFKAVSPGGRIRGVSVQELGGAARRLSQNLPAAWLSGTEAAEEPKLLTADEAKAAAQRFLQSKKLEAGGTVAVDEAPADPARHPSGAWRVSYARPKAKKAAPVVVIVDKKTGEARSAGAGGKR